MAGVQDRVALVTGGAQGIGAATAARLAAGGASVAIADINVDSARAAAAEIIAAGGTAIGVGCDVSDRDQVNAAVEAVVAEFGALHILVNNAGVTRDNMLFKMTDDDWNTVISVHLRGAFLCTQAAQKHMVAAKYGRIVYLSSVAAFGNRGQTNYSTAKAGLQGMAKTVAIELGQFGITSNAIAPGFIATAMTDATAVRIGVTPEEFRAQAAAGLPVRRVGLPEDIANTIMFFASEESGFITGQVLVVDGGRGIV